MDKDFFVSLYLAKADHVVTSEATIDEYDLFSISDTGIINFDGELMF